jgi:hypothetical protein
MIQKISNLLNLIRRKPAKITRPIVFHNRNIHPRRFLQTGCFFHLGRGNLLYEYTVVNTMPAHKLPVFVTFFIGFLASPAALAELTTDAWLRLSADEQNKIVCSEGQAYPNNPYWNDRCRQYRQRIQNTKQKQNLHGKKNYQRCIIEKMPGTSNRAAAASIHEQCSQLPRFEGKPKADFWGPKTKFDCIEKYAKKTPEKIAGALITRACASLYP